MGTDVLGSVRLVEAPLLVPALVFLAAAAAAVELGIRGVPLTVALAGVVHFVGRSRHDGERAAVWAAVVAGVTLGLASAEEPQWHRGLRLERPVEVVGRIDGRWSRALYGWRVRVTIEQVVQESTSVSAGASAQLFLSGARSPPTARKLRLRGYLQRSPRVVNDARRQGLEWRISVKSRRLVKEEAGTSPNVASGLLGDMRAAVARALDRQSTPTSTLMHALLLGDSSQLPAPQLLAMRRAGLGHLLAVSGLHLGMAMASAWLIFLFLPPAWRLLPITVVLVAYTLLVGPRPSVVRAALMAGAMIGALIVERRPSGENAWALAVITMVAVDCSVLRDVGFQLTATATLALVTVAPRLSRRWSTRIPAKLAAPLAVSVTAHLATLPWSLSMFHLWSPSAVLVNLLAVPWTALTLGCGAAAVVCEFVPLCGPAIGRLLWGCVEVLVGPFGWLKELPPSAMSGIPVSLSWWISVPLTAGALATLSLGGRWKVVLLAVGVLVALRPSAPSDIDLVMIDVGQGDAVLLRGGGRALLVDGGGWSTAGVAQTALIPVLADLGIRRLDGIVLTHPDRDHCGGLLELSYLIPIETLWTGPGWEQDCYRGLVRRSSLRLRPLWAGEQVHIGPWTIDVLHPAAGSRGGGNEQSLVLRASRGGFRALLTGDITAAAEARLLERGRDLGADILKVAHHGSGSSTTRSWLEEVRPRVALISAGRANRYGHPSTAVLDRLGDLGIEVWRTDLGGRIDLRIQEGGLYDVRQPFVDAGSSGSR